MRDRGGRVRRGRYGECLNPGGKGLRRTPRRPAGGTPRRLTRVSCPGDSSSRCPLPVSDGLRPRPGSLLVPLSRTHQPLPGVRNGPQACTCQPTPTSTCPVGTDTRKCTETRSGSREVRSQRGRHVTPITTSVVGSRATPVDTIADPPPVSRTVSPRGSVSPGYRCHTPRQIPTPTPACNLMRSRSADK